MNEDDGMCNEEHPYMRIVCMRNENHPGLHWFTYRWESAEAEKVKMRKIMQGVVDEIEDAP